MLCISAIILAILSTFLLLDVLFLRNSIYSLLPPYTACAIAFAGLLIALLYQAVLKKNSKIQNRRHFASFLAWTNLLLCIALTLTWLVRIFLV